MKILNVMWYKLSLFIIGLILCVYSLSVWSDNAASSCANTTVNNASGTCYTVSPAKVDPSGFTIDGSEVGAEWTGAQSNNLTGDMTGSYKVLRSTDAIYLIITINDTIYHASDRISVFVDTMHNHATTTDDIEFRIKRDSGVSPDHRKITNSGNTAWTPATLGSELSKVSSVVSWTTELKLSASELGVADLPQIIGFAIEAESLDSGDLTSWPTNFVSSSPATTWANLKNRLPIEYMIVMDQSGSMLSDSKWDNALSAANYLANTMSILRDTIYFDDEIGTTTFAWDCSGSDNTALADGLSTVGSFPLGDYTSGFTAPGNNNCTPIGSGLDEAFTQLGTGSEETQRIVLLLSDGLHNRPNSSLTLSDLSYTPCGTASWNPCNSTNIQVNTVAFGEGGGSVDEALLNNIKTYYQGEFNSTYSITDDPNDLKEAFINSLDELYQMNLSYTGSSGAEFTIDPNNQKLIVIASWTTVANAGNFKLQQKTLAADPWTDVSCNSLANDTTVGFAICAIDEPASGIWRAVDNMNNALAADRMFVLLDLNLRARFAVDQVIHGTGMDLVLTADLNQAGQQLSHDPASHPVSVTVNIEEPTVGLGTFLSTTSLRGCDNISPQLPAIDLLNQQLSAVSMTSIRNSGTNTTRHSSAAGSSTSTVGSADPAATHFQLAAELLRVCGLSALPRNIQPGLEMYDDASHGDVKADDGVYTLRFSNTQHEGSRVFRFNASGTTPAGDKFTRTKAIAEYVRVEVDPASSETGDRILQQDGTIIIKEFYIIPRDKFNGYLGPGHDSDIRYQVSGAKQLSGVRDYNNGIYAIIVQYDSSIGEPIVTPVVQGKLVDEQAAPCIIPSWYYLLMILMLVIIFFLLLLLIKCRRKYPG